ncbi:MAG TPA: MFS transporter [Methanomassiliicoccales archaeon]|jgi:EmrB/QacA subfamily drug resistance transporter
MSKEKKGLEYGWVVLSVTTIGILMASIQSSALLISLPEMMSSLHMDFLTVMWVILVYMLVTTVAVPVFGRLADMFGRKRLYVLGFAIFSLGSLLCALANAQYQGYDLVGYRIIQGIGGALMMANGAAMVVDAFDARKLGFGLGVNMVAGGAGIVLGPLVGGALSPLGWQWIFLINVPLGVIGTIWAFVRLREPIKMPKGQSFDWAGSSIFTIGLTAFLLALTFIAFPGMMGMEMIYLLFAAGGIGIIAFLYIQTRSRYPMMDLTLFHDRVFALGNTTFFLNSLCRGAVLFLLIFFLQGPYGQDPLTAGISLIPFGITFIIVGPLSGKGSDRYGPRLFTIVGLVLSSASLLGFAFVDHTTPFWFLVVLMVLMGIGGGLFSSPNSSTVMNTVRPEKRGIASGTRTMLGNVGSMFSLALAFPLVLSNISSSELAKLFIVGGGMGTEALHSFESGLHTAFILFFVMSVVAVIISMYRPKKCPENCDAPVPVTSGKE